MKQFRVLLVIAALVLSAVGVYFVVSSILPQQLSQQEALNFDALIVAEQNKSANALQNYANSLDYNDSTLQDELDKIDIVILEINNSIVEVTGLEPKTEYGRNYKTAAINLLSSYSSALEDEYKQIITLLYTNETDEDNLEQIENLIQQISEKETVLDENLVNARDEFLNFYKISLEN